MRGYSEIPCVQIPLSSHSKDEKWIFVSFGNYEQGLHELNVKGSFDGEIYRYKMRGEEKEGIRYPVIVETNDRKKNLIWPLILKWSLICDGSSQSIMNV